MPVTVRDGVSLYHSDEGAGPPVFFHTGGGGDGSMWKTAGYLDLLPGRRHVLFDHRGHGRSGKPAGVDAHRVDEYIADVLAVLDDLGIERAAMVGYSDGAYLLFTLAARHPERVTAVVGMGGVGLPGDTMDYRRSIAERVREVGLARWLRDGSAQEAEPAPDWFLDNLSQTTDEMFLLELEGWLDGPGESDSFPLIQAPTFIVCGDTENGDGAAEVAVELLPDGQAEIIPGFGHLQLFWRSDVTGRLIADFLARRAPIA